MRFYLTQFDLLTVLTESLYTARKKAYLELFNFQLDVTFMVVQSEKRKSEYNGAAAISFGIKALIQ